MGNINDNQKIQKFLVCDDDETLCYLLKEQLLEEGFAVDTVYDGKYAIEAIKANSITMFFCLILI